MTAPTPRPRSLAGFLFGPSDPVRVDAFRAAFAASLLAYFAAWWSDPYEWLTEEGFHVSSAALGWPAAPLLPAAALPLFGIVLFGAIVAVVVGLGLPYATWAVLALVVYVTFADAGSAFTMNKLYIAGFAVLAVAGPGAYFRIRGRGPDPAPSAWPLRILQAVLLLHYGTAGLCKVLHGTWIADPLTLFSQAQGQYRTDACAWLLRNLPLDAWKLMQHSALAFELLAPVLFAVRRLRPLAFAWGAAFQLLVALTMKDLIYFSAQMMTFYVLFMDDATLHALRAWWRRRVMGMVEAVGVEPTSENTPTKDSYRLSPA